MSNVLSWVFELGDRLSSPATRMAKALDDVEDRLKAADIALAKSRLDKIKDPLEHTAAALRIQRDELHNVAEAHRNAGEHAGVFWERLRHGLETVHFGGEILHGVVERVREFGAEIVENMRFKQANLLALEAMTGSRDAAIGIFETVESFAGKLGTSVRGTMDQTRDLLSYGYSPSQIGVLRPMLADLGVIGERQRGGVEEALRTVAIMGNLGPRANMVLRQAGVSLEVFNRELAATHGDTLLALMRALSQRYDPKGRGWGALTQDLSKTLPGAIDRVKQLPELMSEAFSGWDAGAGGGLFARALTNIADAFMPGSETSERIISRIRSLVDSVAKALGLGGEEGGFLAELAGPNGGKKIEDVFNHIADAVERTVPKIVKVANAVGVVADAIVKIAALPVFGGDGLGPAGNARDMARETLADPSSSVQARQKARQVLGMQPEQPPAYWSLGSRPPVSESAGQPRVAHFSPTVHITIEGKASKDDADHIASKVTDALSPWAATWEQLQLQGGSGG